MVVFLGSTREVRLGERVAKFMIRKLQERRLDVEFVGIGYNEILQFFVIFEPSVRRCQLAFFLLKACFNLVLGAYLEVHKDHKFFLT